MVLELVLGADFWCNRHCRTSPVVLEMFWGQVWPKIGRKPEKSEYRIANEPLSLIRLPLTVAPPRKLFGKGSERDPTPAPDRAAVGPRTRIKIIVSTARIRF